MEQAGLVAVAFVGLWFAYLVPHRLRFRQQLLEARTEDRFSDELRVVRVAGARGEPQAEGTGAHHGPGRPVPSAQDLERGPRRPYLHPPGRGDGTMHRPHGAADRITADAARAAAVERARRVAHLARRRAAARRRAVLTAVLLVAGVAGWSLVGATSLPVAVGAVPSAGLLLTLALGRRAVVAGRRADAAWAARSRELVALPQRTSGVVGRAVHPSEAQTEVMTRVGRTSARTRAAAPSSARGSAPTRTRDDGRDVRTARTDERRTADRPAPSTPAAPTAPAEPATRTAVEEPREDTWAPVPVPRPTYALKSEARRPEPAPLVLDERPAAPAATTAPSTATTAPTTTTAPAEGAAASGLPTGGRALDALLERRRAAGE